MKTTPILYVAVALVFLFSCVQKENISNLDFENESENFFSANTEQQEAYSQNDDMQQNSQQVLNNRLKPYKKMSKQFGIPVGVMPIPSSWKISNNTEKNILFETESGIKVYNEYFQYFSYANNLERNQIMQQQGYNIQAIKPLERVIHEDFKPYLETKDVYFVKQYPLPQLAQFDQRFDSYIFKATPENKQFQCMVTEWKDKNGIESVVVIRYFVTHYTSIGGTDWGYTINVLDAPSAVFEDAKHAFINSLVNFQINPEWVQANNQYYMRLRHHNNAKHQERMAAINAQGQAMRNAGQMYSDILDSNHESWKRRSGMQDAGHASAVNGIWERSNMTDPSGNTYQVEGYNNHVWTNGNNEYIGTDNSFYNPNTDNTTNNQSWEQLEYTGD